MPFAPAVGQSVTAFGYRRGSIRSSKNTQGGMQIDLDDEPMLSIGIVRDIFEWKRDSFRLPFPCYQVEARFDGGMSGGPFLTKPVLCAASSARTSPAQTMTESQFRQPRPQPFGPSSGLSFPLIGETHFPRGVHYPAIDLVRGGQIKVSDQSGLESWFATHIK